MRRMDRQLIGRRLVAAASEDERQAASRIGFSQQQPARFVVRRLDDPACEEDGALEERLDLRWLDPVLPVLAEVASIPIELLCSTSDPAQPLVKAAVRRDLH